MLNRPFFRWVNLLFWIFLLSCAFLRNAPSSGLRNSIREIDKFVLTPLAFFHRGWGMFPDETRGALATRLRYTYLDGTEVVHDYFPLKSSFWPSVWNEVM